MSRSRLVLTLVLAGLALTPAVGVAQGAAQTHTVKKGDTLWDLAQQYLGDAFRWPEIYRRNSETVQDPNLIYPDQVLIISGDVVATPGTPADVPPMPTDTMASLPSAGGGAAMPRTAYVQKPMTIFNPDKFRVDQRGPRESMTMSTRPSAVRPGDYLRAPFLWDANGVTGAGKVGAPLTGEGIRVAPVSRPLQVYETIHVTVPAGAVGTVGEQFISFRMGPTITGKGRVVVQTGVVKLLGAPRNGEAEAMLLTKFEEVFRGHGLMAMDTLAMPMGVFPSRVEFGVQTSLAWLYEEPVLSSIGQQMILAAGASEGLVPGDQVTIQRPTGADMVAMDDFAVVQVTRVTRWGASAILIGQTDGLLTPGQKARVTAKMP